MRPKVGRTLSASPHSDLTFQSVNVERIVAARMARKNRTLSSRPVVRIATSGVALGVALMILAASIVDGFQHEVQNLVVGFDSHLLLTTSDPGSQGVWASPALWDSLENLPEAKHIAFRHERAGIVETPEALQGVVIRGLDSTSYLERIENGMHRGRMPNEALDLLVGVPLAEKLRVDTGDRLTLYVVVGPDNIRPRNMTITGIYETGLMEFDKRHVWMRADALQEAANRGAEGQVVLELTSGGPRATGQSFGRDDRGVKWSGRWTNLPPGISAQGRRTLLLSDVPMDARPAWVVGEGALADTVTLIWDQGWKAPISKGTHHMVVDGFDVWGHSLGQLPALQQSAFSVIPYDWTAARVDQQHPEMFSWLRMLDLNVDVIVGLMVLISIVNMTSALLIIILERRNQIGLLKALGMSDAALVRTFMWHAATILGTGFVWGNVLGFGLAWSQSHWKLIPLDPAAYYVDAVPVLLDLPRIGLMESLAFATCVLAMLLPAMWSARIQPAITLRMR